MLEVNDFSAVRITLASPEQIRSWSYGEVTKPETINYRTLKPEKDGLFCERIFGPTKDFECYCGKYKRIRFKGVVCDKCGVEVARAKVRRERMGHIDLACPVSHIWFVKGTPSRLGLLLDLSPRSLEHVIYFARFIITDVNQPELERLVREAREEAERRRGELEVWLKARADEVRSRLAEERQQAEKEGKLEEEEEAEGRALAALTDELQKKQEEREAEIENQLREKLDELEELRPLHLLTEADCRKLRDSYGGIFKASMGAEAVLEVLSHLDLDKLREELHQELASTSGQRRKKASKRLRVVEAFRKSGNRPEWMVFTVLPVLPPDLRPMVQLDGGRFATSDLNDLYRRVINRNNRLKRLLELKAPDIIIRNEKRMLQEAVDSLIDNGRRGRAVTTGNNHRLKSLSDMLRGKQGRFRQNLLGKRVDYSGRSVIVVGPELKLHQCGLPRRMALELFKPFVMHRLVAEGLAHNIKSAKRIVERVKPEVWDVLEEVIKERPVFLNRAPTLHRLGIQAFEPILINGSAIQVHPLVCTAFNADFDGDQMAVHVPLSRAAVEEARQVMLSTNNMLSPSSGEPVVAPTLDMVLGCYYLTIARKGARGEGKAFANIEDAKLALELGVIDLQAEIGVRLDEPLEVIEGKGIRKQVVAGQRLQTTVGRLLFNFGDQLQGHQPHERASSPLEEALSLARENRKEELATLLSKLPAHRASGLAYGLKTRSLGFYNQIMDKGALKQLVAECIHRLGHGVTGLVLDDIKSLGFHYATRSGITIGIDDVETPEAKAKLLARAEEDMAQIERQYQRGNLSEEERYQETVKLWNEVTEEMKKTIEATLYRNGSVYMMATSGAKGNISQITQMAGMRGLMTDPSGRIIDLPIRSSFREGLSVLEYFISTHGARKGLADTALRTADSGYLTRRLIDVSQDVIVLEEDCGSTQGIWLTDPKERGILASMQERLVGRVAAEAVVHPGTGQVLVARGEEIDERQAEAIVKAGIEKVLVRSPLTCASRRGICRRCYGRDLARGQPVSLREAVGIMAAQSIGEPGTQLTMRTFHTGGVVGLDITSGLPRVEELFEARAPKGQAVLADIAGTVEIVSDDEGRRLRLTSSEIYRDEYALPPGFRCLVEPGQSVEAGVVLAEPEPTQEANSPEKAIATPIMARMGGQVTLEGDRLVVYYEEREEREYPVPAAVARILVPNGAKVKAGEQLTEGSLNPQDILRIMGREAVQRYIVDEVQKVYRSQGVNINDKHIEIIVRQMLRRVRIDSPGDTGLLPGELVDRFNYESINAKVLAEGGEPATAQTVLLGVTKASLNTDSFLAAASFQETTRVLTEAAIEGKTDRLFGLKENVIIGKLVPARALITMPPPKRLLAPEAEEFLSSKAAPISSGESV